jgi:hypothetical protein
MCTFFVSSLSLSLGESINMAYVVGIVLRLTFDYLNEKLDPADPNTKVLRSLKYEA